MFCAIFGPCPVLASMQTALHPPPPAIPSQLAKINQASEASNAPTAKQATGRSLITTLASIGLFLPGARDTCLFHLTPWLATCRTLRARYHSSDRPYKQGLSPLSFLMSTVLQWSSRVDGAYWYRLAPRTRRLAAIVHLREGSSEATAWPFCSSQSSTRSSLFPLISLFHWHRNVRRSNFLASSLE